MTTLRKDLAVLNEEYKPTFKSDALNTEFTRIASAYRAGNKAMWKLAKSVHKVLTDELWKVKGDFQTEGEFAKAIGKSQAQISAYKNAVEFLYNHNDLYQLDGNGDIVTNIGFSKADILARVDDYDKFDNWVVENYKAHAVEFGDNSIKTMLKSYNKPELEDKSQEGIQEGTQEGTQETKEEAKTSISIILKDGYKVEYDGIPVSIVDKVANLLSEYRQATYDTEGNKITA